MAIGDTTLRVERINGYMTELMEILVEAPKLRVVFIPGNPGIIPFYKSYLEALSQSFGENANITGIGYVGHTCKDLEKGKLFSLEEQVEHKIQFVQKVVADEKIPLVLVGHSIGAHMALCVFKRFPDKVQHVVALYPFLATNEGSCFQSFLKWSLRQNFLCEALAYFASFVGRVPKTISRGLLKNVFGRNWSQFSVDVACQYLLQYSLVRNIMYLGMTEFKKLQRHPDWEFLIERQSNISILFGVDDHWGPLTLFEEMTGQAPHLDVEIEHEGHDHAFCCTEDGSYWVAAYCAKTIRKMLPKLEPVLLPVNST
ncbi:hypothetical protein GOP47_0017995 [Adiantum capillus-veneris]|uniref:Lipid droplet-associated hydrolase n=1 Tax=Adiantum capillus-veneris TaxID=13818 RepID=A0A9D4UGY0_ADICA|nr:hypothetical protein GOP47_0017995 [Adiantum capillus-veneris]